MVYALPKIHSVAESLAAPAVAEDRSCFYSCLCDIGIDMNPEDAAQHTVGPDGGQSSEYWPDSLRTCFVPFHSGGGLNKPAGTSRTRPLHLCSILTVYS